MLIDTHSHLNFKAFNKDREEVIKRSLENNVWLINASSTFDTSKLAVEIAEQYDEGVYASVGLHPIHVKDEEFDVEKYRNLTKSKKVVAIGETGLDYMYPHTKRGQGAKSAKDKISPRSGVGVYPEQEKQKKIFLEHLALAQELALPVIFHCRKAHKDMIDILLRRSDLLKSQGGLTSLSGVIHCFTGRWSQAKQYLDMGLHLGFNGIMYKMDLEEVIKKAPLDKMLIETDCPYLTPSEAKIERNEPIFVKYIAERIAELRGESLETIAEATTQNAKKLFKI